MIKVIAIIVTDWPTLAVASSAGALLFHLCLFWYSGFSINLIFILINMLIIALNVGIKIGRNES